MRHLILLLFVFCSLNLCGQISKTADTAKHNSGNIKFLTPDEFPNQLIPVAAPANGFRPFEVKEDPHQWDAINFPDRNRPLLVRNFSLPQYSTKQMFEILKRGLQRDRVISTGNVSFKLGIHDPRNVRGNN